MKTSMGKQKNKNTGVIKCTQNNLDLNSISRNIILTTSAAFSGTLLNSASITPTNGIVDNKPANNIATSTTVRIIGWDYHVYLPLTLK